MSAMAFAERWAEGPAAWFEARLPTGPRPRELSVKGLLVALFLTADGGSALHLTRAASFLSGLTARDKQRLGVPAQVTYRHVERLWTIMAALIDPAPVYSRRAKRRDPLTRGEIVERQGLQDDIVDLIFEATIPVKYKDQGSYAVDGTDVEEWACPPTRNRHSTNPSAAWGRRRAKRPNAGGQPDEMFWGWNEQVMTMVNDEGKPPVPELVRRETLTPANVHQAPASLVMLARYRSGGGNAGDLLADSAYPYADGWTTAVAALGFSPIVDIHPNLLGRKGTEQGAFVVDDLLLCPMTPMSLIDVKRPGSDAAPDEWDRYFEQVAERAKYSFATHGRPDAEGDQRVKCPASCGKARCILKPRSMSNPLTGPKIVDGPEPGPTCCTQETMTITRAVAEKLRQKHRYCPRSGTPPTTDARPSNAASPG